MNPRTLGATVGRILRQILHDRRTLAIVLIIPVVIITLVHFLFEGAEPFVSKLEADMLVIFPIIVMFLLTAIATVRERTSGTLERLLTTPVRKADILFGYAIAYGILGAIQVSVGAAFCYLVLDMQVAGPGVLVYLCAILSSQLGVAFGLLASAISTTEFQAIQMFPAVLTPQILLSGLFGPREDMAGWLTAISDWLPIIYAVESMEELVAHASVTELFWRDLAIVVACVLGLLVVASATLRRRTA